MHTLYIQIVNGSPVSHPAYEENLKQVFGSIPPEWEPFTRVVKPPLAVYQTVDDSKAAYEKVNSVWTDMWHRRSMTALEKATKQQDCKDAWAARSDTDNMGIWDFDPAICAFVPPRNDINSVNKIEEIS